MHYGDKSSLAGHIIYWCVKFYTNFKQFHWQLFHSVPSKLFWVNSIRRDNRICVLWPRTGHCSLCSHLYCLGLLHTLNHTHTSRTAEEGSMWLQTTAQDTKSYTVSIPWNLAAKPQQKLNTTIYLTNEDELKSVHHKQTRESRRDHDSYSPDQTIQITTQTIILFFSFWMISRSFCMIICGSQNTKKKSKYQKAQQNWKEKVCVHTVESYIISSSFLQKKKLVLYWKFWGYCWSLLITEENQSDSRSTDLKDCVPWYTS